MNAAPLPELSLPRHIGIVTSDLRRAMDALGATLDLTWNDPTETSQHVRHAGGVTEWALTVVHSSAGPLRVELLQGPPDSPWHTTGLARLHHYAYTTDDLAADCDRLVPEGWEVEVTVAHDTGRPHAFAYLVRPKRPRVELIQTATGPARAG